MITPRPLFANNQLQTLSVIFAGTPDRRLAGMSNLPSCYCSVLSAAVKRDSEIHPKTWVGDRGLLQLPRL